MTLPYRIRIPTIQPLISHYLGTLGEEESSVHIWKSEKGNTEETIRRKGEKHLYDRKHVRYFKYAATILSRIFDGLFSITFVDSMETFLGTPNTEEQTRENDWLTPPEECLMSTHELFSI
jgi:hypothetical protein